MIVRVVYFAVLRHQLGRRGEEVEIPDGATVAELSVLLESRHESLQGMMARVAIAVNHEYATPERVLEDGDEVALLPPVAGGAPDDRVPLAERAQVKDTPLDVAALSELVKVEEGGAIVTFTGMVRKQSQGREVTRLDYEAYGPMAVKEMQTIVAEIEREWPGAIAAIHHRVGALEIGELAVVIAVCTPHRKEAFEACSYAIERLKERVPIWKHESFTDGSEWVGWGP